MSGAIDVYACQTRTPKFHNCRCELCVICGYRKHTGIHGAIYGEPEGSKPWGHEFRPLDPPICISYPQLADQLTALLPSPKETP